MGVLNSHRRFFLPYFAPVVWNAAIIAALWLVGGQWSQQFRGGGGGGFPGDGPLRGALAEPATYVVELTVDGMTYSSTVTIREDPALDAVQ